MATWLTSEEDCRDWFTLIINAPELSKADIAAARRSCKAFKQAVDASLNWLQPLCCDLQQLAQLLGTLPALKDLSLTDACQPLHACYKDYAQLAQHVPVLIGQLSAATSLTSLTLSSKDIQQLGTLKWAHQVAQQHKSARKHSQPSAAQPHPGRQQRPAGHDKWYRGQYAAFAADSRHQVYWIPDWLATAPGLKKLAIQPPTASAGSSRWPSFNPCLPACLWLHPKPWASKLTSLEVHNVPLTATLPPTIPRLVQLKTLALVACCLQPSAVEQLFKGLAKGAPRLQVLILSQNDLWQLPQEDWHALLELQELDLSSNQLILLPAGMSQLTTLTALHLQHNQLPSVPAHLSTLWNLSHLDLSHNWLSGLRDTPHFSALLSSWRQLRVLRLENVSDKRGGLKLPAELQQCEGLRELTLGHQFSLDWSSLQLLSCCKALHVLGLAAMSGATVPFDVSMMLSKLRHKLQVVWD